MAVRLPRSKEKDPERWVEYLNDNPSAADSFLAYVTQKLDELSVELADKVRRESIVGAQRCVGAIDTFKLLQLKLTGSLKESEAQKRMRDDNG